MILNRQRPTNWIKVSGNLGTARLSTFGQEH
jgi:hypothetical protein